MDNIFLIVGLGNPGIMYEKSWHNLGFITLKYFTEKENINNFKLQHKSIVGHKLINNKKIFTAFPQTYMNNSGDAIVEIINYYKIPHQNILIIYDDLDLIWGNIKIREKGSSGTHNGMRSISNILGHQNFARLRIGMGPKPEHYDLADFVLSKIDKKESQKLNDISEVIYQTILIWIKEGINNAQNYLANNKKI